eukprot:COSAG06_NODE_1798_length_8368_cov_4.946668_8_plen_106_part_00
MTEERERYSDLFGLLFWQIILNGLACVAGQAATRVAAQTAMQSTHTEQHTNASVIISRISRCNRNVLLVPGSEGSGCSGRCIARTLEIALILHATHRVVPHHTTP